MRRADFDEDDAECAAGEDEEPAETCEPGFLGETFKKKEENANSGKDAQSGVKKDGDGVRNVGGGKRVEINGGNSKNKNAKGAPASHAFPPREWSKFIRRHRH